jgi:hypothetical protein
MVYAGLGDREQTLQWLERGYQIRQAAIHAIGMESVRGAAGRAEVPGDFGKAGAETGPCDGRLKLGSFCNHRWPSLA